LSRLSHLIKRLEARGLVRREPDATDGRFTVAILTNAGQKKLLASAPGHVDCVRQLVVGDFTAAEQAKLRDMSDRIVARIEASGWKHNLL
jgi:DNA-binding MarR family transcriptional regulator